MGFGGYHARYKVAKHRNEPLLQFKRQLCKESKGFRVEVIPSHTSIADYTIDGGEFTFAVAVVIGKQFIIFEHEVSAHDGSMKCMKDSSKSNPKKKFGTYLKYQHGG